MENYYKFKYCGYSKNQVIKAHRFLRKNAGLNLSLEVTAKLLRQWESELPKITRKPLRERLDHLEIRGFKYGRPIVIAEATRPEVLDVTKRKKGKRWKVLLRLGGMRGEFMISEGKKCKVYTLAHVGGVHKDYHVLTEVEAVSIIHMLKKAFPGASRKLREGGRVDLY